MRSRRPRGRIQELPTFHCRCLQDEAAVTATPVVVSITQHTMTSASRQRLSPSCEVLAGSDPLELCQRASAARHENVDADGMLIDCLHSGHFPGHCEMQH